MYKNIYPNHRKQKTKDATADKKKKLKSRMLRDKPVEV